MVETEKLVDQEKVNALISAATGAALDLGCNWLECAQAFRALMNSSLAMIGGNVKEILLEFDRFNGGVLDSKTRVVKGGDANDSANADG